MDRAVVMRGRLQGSHIELERPVAGLAGEVEVVVRSLPGRTPPARLLELIATLPPGSRTKEDIDRQLSDERDGWERGG